MEDLLSIGYDESKEDVAALCVSRYKDGGWHTLKILYGVEAKEMYKKLVGKVE